MATTFTAKQIKRLAGALNSVQQTTPAASKNGKSRKGRSRRQAKKENAGINLVGSRLSYSSEPVAQSCSITNPTYLRVSKAVSHNDFGSGVRIEGRQLLTDITTTAGDNQLFAGTGTASTTINAVLLSPDILNGRLALQARTYSRYAFRRVVLHYVPRVATTDVGQFVLSYNIDSAASNVSSGSFAALTSNSTAMVTAFRKEAKMAFSYSGDMTWATEYDTTDYGGQRTTAQGAIQGYPDASSIGALQHGWVWIEYVIDLYGSSQDFGFTLSLKSEEEKRVAAKAVRVFRAEFDHLVEEDDFTVPSAARDVKRR